MILEILKNEIFVLSAITILLLLEIFLIFKLTQKNRNVNKSDNLKEVKFLKINEEKEDQIPSELETVLEKMQKTLEQEEKEVCTFEKEQEEKAIISYQELLKANKKTESITESSEQKISLERVLDQVETNTSNKNFRNTEVISPIYGKQNNNYIYPTIPSFSKKEVVDKKETYSEEKINESMIKNTPPIKPNNDNEAFLNYLKNFRKNLD